MIRTLTCLAFLGAAVVSSTASAQWTQPAGGGYAKVSGTLLAGSKAFDVGGEVIDVSDFRDVSLNVYGELGLSKNLTAFLSSRPVGMIVYDRLDEGYSGTTLIGARVALLRGAINATAEVYAGGNPWAIGDVTGSDQLVFDPAVRSARLGWTLRVGKSFGRFWASASGGLSWWDNVSEVSPAILGGAQFGATLPAGFVVEIHASLREPIDPVTKLNIAGGGQTRYLGLGVGASWWFVDWMSVTLAADSALYAESNAAAIPMQLGVEFKF